MEFMNCNPDFRRIRSFVKTADGRSQTVCGYVIADVTFHEGN